MKVLFGCFSNPSVVKIPLSSATALRSFHGVRLAVPIPSGSGARRRDDRTPATTGFLDARRNRVYERTATTGCRRRAGSDLYTCHELDLARTYRRTADRPLYGYRYVPSCRLSANLGGPMKAT